MYAAGKLLPDDSVVTVDIGSATSFLTYEPTLGEFKVNGDAIFGLG